MRRVKGDKAFTKLIGRLPDMVREEIREQMNRTGEEQLARMQSEAPVRTGALRGGLSAKVTPSGLRLKVGLVGKPINRKLFYGRIVEFGRKGQTVRARRAGGKPYLLRIKGMAPRPFVYNVNREAIYAPFRAIWDRALANAAAGVSDE